MGFNLTQASLTVNSSNLILHQTSPLYDSYMDGNIVPYTIKIQGGKLSRFINNIHYVGITFVVCPRPPVLVF